MRVIVNVGQEQPRDYAIVKIFESCPLKVAECPIPSTVAVLISLNHWVGQSRT